MHIISARRKTFYQLYVLVTLPTEYICTLHHTDGMTMIYRATLLLTLLLFSIGLHAQDCTDNPVVQSTTLSTDQTIYARESLTLKDVSFASDAVIQLESPIVYIEGTTSILNSSNVTVVKKVCSPTETRTFLPSDEDFPNPERGFYRYSETRASDYSPLDANYISTFRNTSDPGSGANYQVNSTLLYRYFVLDSYVSSDIPASFINQVQADFDAVRAAGLKMIPRFVYTIDAASGDGCPNWTCPPYGDASKAWVLRHIDQLKQVVNDNYDVIATFQMGWIGTWGENYYTDHFGDASLPPFRLTNQNWNDRKDVLDSLLRAWPADRMIQVRYPQMKQRYLYGPSAPTTSPNMLETEAYNQTDISRIGFHNDCFLSQYDDQGTYWNYGNDAAFANEDTTNLKPYARSETRYVVMGGETCNDAYSPQNDCFGTNPLAEGDKELERFHYSFLHAQYNNEVQNDWTGICMEDIKRRLGYRLALTSFSAKRYVQPGHTWALNFDIENSGYAALYNPRNVNIILRNGTQVYTLPVDIDPRSWSPGDISSISADLCIPQNIPLGNYEVLVQLSDPMPALENDPRYSIRLATKLLDGSDVWESTTGYNNTGLTLTIDGITDSMVCQE